ncbi:MAG: hypothetical protein DCC49_02055 [Acidobacteria bacterium]|nr:MAG: hypothetical protein DCC49_02055 [Acidobacteriota bacterium]
MAVGAAGFLLAAGGWFALWPYAQRGPSALGAGLLAALFCGAASWMRSHDDAWEAANLRTEPLLSPSRAKRNRSANKATRAAKKADKPPKAQKKKRGKGAPPAPSGPAPTDPAAPQSASTASEEAGVGHGGIPS